MPIVRRFTSKKIKPTKTGNIVKRQFTGARKAFADNVEEYVFNLPTEPIAYTDLVTRWVLPYRDGHFTLYGQKIRLTPKYTHLLDSRVKITGIMCELVHPTKPKRKIIEGSRGIWHGQLKFFVKTTMAEMT